MTLQKTSESLKMFLKQSSFTDIVQSLGANSIFPVETTANESNIQPVQDYVRMTYTPSNELQNKAREILGRLRSKPLGSSEAFTQDGVEYLAVLERHNPSSRNPNPHPGISLFYKPKQTVNNIQLSDRSKRLISELVPELQEVAKSLLLKGLELGLNPEIVEGYRSQTRQDELYEQGRTKPGNIVTWTRNSKHTSRRAFDIAQLQDGKITYNATPGFWETMGSIGESLGLVWGGRFRNPDKPHFQLKDS